jgi:copper homeostasis protein
VSDLNFEVSDLNFEVCIDSVVGANIAQEAGAHRVELCQALSVGGTTPSAAMIQRVRATCQLGLHVLIRPRGGDFCFNDEEWAIMARDVELAGEWGADGVVIGGLRDDGTVDGDHCARLIDLARPMSATFHRAFDLCSDAHVALEELVDLGVDYVLTSGQAATAHEGRDLLRQLVDVAADRLIVLAGAGINEHNVRELVCHSRVQELHFSARSTCHVVEAVRQVSMGSDARADLVRDETDLGRVRAIIHAAISMA